MAASSLILCLCISGSDSHFHSKQVFHLVAFESLQFVCFFSVVAIAFGVGGGDAVFVLNLSCKPFCSFAGFFFNSVVVAVVVRFIWCILCFISCAGCREAFLILLLYQRVWSCALCIAIACGAMILVHRCIAKFATLHKYIAYADHANFVYKPTTKNTDDEHCMQWN